MQITNNVHYSSDTSLGHIEINMRRLQRKDFFKVMPAVKLTTGDGGIVMYEIPATNMPEAVDIMCGFLPDYIKSLKSDIVWDGASVTNITQIMDEVLFFGIMSDICMTLFRESSSINEEQEKNLSELPKTESSESGQQQSTAPTTQSEASDV